jgi:ribosome-binding protein aMBF1 (putative translation factor)
MVALGREPIWEDVLVDSFEKGYENFKLGAILQEARLKKGYTQELLALKLDTTKSYILKIENDTKEILLSNLQR